MIRNYKIHYLVRNAIGDNIKHPVIIHLNLSLKFNIKLTLTSGLTKTSLVKP